MKKRTDISDKYKINCSELFKSDEEFIKEYKVLSEDINKISKFKNKVYESDASLNEVLSLDEEISIRLNTLYIYAHLNNDFDLDDAKNSENYGKVIILYNKYSNLSSYLVPEILSKSYNFIEELLKKDKNLKKHENILKEIFREKKHILSKKEEELLSSLSDAFRAPNEIASKLRDVDLNFDNIIDENGNSVEFNESIYALYSESKNRGVRKNAFDNLYDSYKNIVSSSAAALAGEIRNQNAVAKIRKYKSAFERSMNSNNVPTSIYENLIKSVNKNLKHFHKYYELKKKILGYNELHLYDMNAPVVSGNNKIYSYEESKDLIINSLEPMGREYVEVIKRSFEENWIDVYNNENKRSGAYCTCAYKTHPYVLLNFEGTYDNVSTISHELGHALHYYYAQNNNSYSDYDYSIFVAEVASQVNEILLVKYLLNKKDITKDEKLFLLNQILNDFRGSVARQTMFAEFEKEIYDYDLEEEVITSEYLCEKYKSLIDKYFGPSVTIDDVISCEWARVPHFYYNFYVYQYATGYIAASLIAENIYNKKENALENYIKFLKLGSTLDPVSSLKVAGVDMLDTKIYDKAFKIYEETLEKFKKTYYSED